MESESVNVNKLRETLRNEATTVTFLFKEDTFLGLDTYHVHVTGEETYHTVWNYSG